MKLGLDWMFSWRFWAESLDFFFFSSDFRVEVAAESTNWKFRVSGRASVCLFFFPALPESNLWI